MLCDKIEREHWAKNKTNIIQLLVTLQCLAKWGLNWLLYLQESNQRVNIIYTQHKWVQETLPSWHLLHCLWDTGSHSWLGTIVPPHKSLGLGSLCLLSPPPLAPKLLQCIWLLTLMLVFMFMMLKVFLFPTRVRVRLRRGERVLRQLKRQKLMNHHFAALRFTLVAAPRPGTRLLSVVVFSYLDTKWLVFSFLHALSLSFHIVFHIFQWVHSLLSLLWLQAVLRLLPLDVPRVRVLWIRWRWVSLTTIKDEFS